MKHIKLIIKSFIVTFAVLAAQASAYAMPEPVSAVNVVAEQPTVKVVAGGVEVTVPGDAEYHVTVYALTGQIVKSLNVTSGVNFVELPKGYYIVKCGVFSSRIVVK